MQTVLLSVNEVGLTFVVVQLARKPGLTVADGAMDAFHDALVTATAAPVWVCVAFQIWVICWPSAKDQRRVHPFTVEVPVLVIFTSPWKPSGHWPSIA